MPVKSAPGLRIKQERGRKTFDALITTGFRLLQDRELESLSIAELAHEAGYSVGAFYARFRSKDEFFDALLQYHLSFRRERTSRIFATVADDDLIDAYVGDMVDYFWTRRGFWRSALIRSTRDLDFWTPIRKFGHAVMDSLIERIEKRINRTLTKTEESNIRFAFQVTAATINNTILNRPGPSLIGQEQFLRHLARAFRIVSDYDAIIARPRRSTKARTSLAVG